MKEGAIYARLSGYIAAGILEQPNRVLRRDEPLISSSLIDSFNRVNMLLIIDYKEL
jgi:hypothetical protein